MTDTTWKPTHRSILDGSVARCIEATFGQITLENEDGDVIFDHSTNWRDIRLVPTISQSMWRVVRLAEDGVGRVTVTMQAPTNIGGTVSYQTMEFTTLDPPALGDVFTVTITPKES